MSNPPLTLIHSNKSEDGPLDSSDLPKVLPQAPKTVKSSLIRRFGAFTIDFFIVYALWYLVVGCISLVALLGISLLIDDFTPGPLFYPAILIGLVFSFQCMLHVYFIYNEYRYGATPGKKMLGLSVRSHTANQKLILPQLVIREVTRYLDALCLGLCVLAFIKKEKWGRLGDFLSDTTVVKLQEKESIELSFISKELFEKYQYLVKDVQLPSSTKENYLPWAINTFILKRPTRYNDLTHWESIFLELIDQEKSYFDTIEIPHFLHLLVAEHCIQHTDRFANAK